jgi:CRISPR-associated protein Cas5d
MGLTENTFCLEVRGDFACFTRPELKVERVSYDVITPGAARNIFQAILWKPAMDWVIERIEVLNPIKLINLRRNELASRISVGTVKPAMNAGHGNLGVYIEEDRQQRAGLLLRDVAYRLHAHLVLTPKAGAGDTPQKFSEMFRRRASAGQCINQPYLGTREFSCAFRLIETMAGEPPPQPINQSLGLLLYDLDYTTPSAPQPVFFRAQLKDGVLDVPAPDSTELLR